MILLGLVLASALVATAVAMGRRTPKTAPGNGSMDATADISPSEWRGAYSAEAAPSARIIESGAEWERLWRDSINQPAPAVNFSKYLAGAVFLGAQPTGGYGVEFLPPLANAQELALRYRVVKPKGFVTQAFTQPYGIKLYKKTGLRVSVAEERG